MLLYINPAFAKKPVRSLHRGQIETFLAEKLAEAERAVTIVRGLFPGALPECTCCH